MKKLTLLLLLTACLSLQAQTVFNAAFEKVLKPISTLGKRDTSFIDTVYLSSTPVTFTINKLSVNAFAIDSVTSRNSIPYNTIVEFGTGLNNQNYKTSKKFFNDQFADIQSYTIAPHNEDMSFTFYGVKNLIVKTRIVINQTAAPTTPVIYMHYNINGQYF